MDQRDTILQPKRCNLPSRLQVRLFQQFNRIDFLRAGFETEPGKHQLRPRPDLYNGLAVQHFFEGIAIRGIPAGIAGEQPVNGLIVDIEFGQRRPYFDTRRHGERPPVRPVDGFEYRNSTLQRLLGRCKLPRS